MPNICQEISDIYCTSSYEKPAFRIGNWNVFLDPCGFLPAAGNIKLVGKVLAWNRGVDHYYGSVVGNEIDGAFRYEKGATWPVGAVENCIIDGQWIMRNGMEALGREINLAFDRLAEFVCKSEHLDNPLA